MAGLKQLVTNTQYIRPFLEDLITETNDVLKAVRVLVLLVTAEVLNEMERSRK